MGYVLSPKGFLQVGGVVLVLVAALGYVGVIGPTPEQSIFGATWYFDTIENIVHLILGVVALAAAFVLGMSMQKPLVILVGVVGVLAGLYSLLVSTNLGARVLRIRLTLSCTSSSALGRCGRVSRAATAG